MCFKVLEDPLRRIIKEVEQKDKHNYTNFLGEEQDSVRLWTSQFSKFNIIVKVNTNFIKAIHLKKEEDAARVTFEVFYQMKLWKER